MSCTREFRIPSYVSPNPSQSRDWNSHLPKGGKWFNGKYIISWGPRLLIFKQKEHHYGGGILSSKESAKGPSEHMETFVLFSLSPQTKTLLLNLLNEMRGPGKATKDTQGNFKAWIFKGSKMDVMWLWFIIIKQMFLWPGLNILWIEVPRESHTYVVSPWSDGVESPRRWRTRMPQIENRKYLRLSLVPSIAFYHTPLQLR